VTASSTDSAFFEPLAIIGIGCHFPGATDALEFWSRIVERHDAIRPVPESHWRAEDYLDPDPKSPDRVYSARGGFLDPVPFNPAAFGIPPTNIEATDASQLLGLMVAQAALEDCGYSISGREGPKTDSRQIDRSRISVILGVTGTLQLVIPLGARLGHPLWKRALKESGVDEAVAAQVMDRIAEGYVPWQENSFPGLLGNVVAGRIANRFDLGGTNCVVDAACASSLSAVHLAAMELTTRRADVVLTGGVDTFNDIFMFTCFSKTPALSATGNAKPFDAAGDGTVLGEGLGMVVLKRLTDAQRDGDKIYAVLRGLGSSSDGKGGAIYAPRKEGQIDALNNAYRAAGVDPSSIGLVEAHGTGTKVGDATEVTALAEVYSRDQGRREAPWCAIGSIKSQIGHTKAAAGAAGLIKAALALYHKVLPPTIKVKQPLEVLQQPGCPLYVNTEKRPWIATGPRRAAISAFGFGGSNFHAVLEEADANKATPAGFGEVEILALSGPSREHVLSQLATIKPETFFEQARLSRLQWQSGQPYRILVVARREQSDVAKLLQSASSFQTNAAEGVFCGSGAAPGKLAVLFPGQGAQYLGMLRDVVCHFPTAFGRFAQAGPELVDQIYPHSLFDEARKKAAEDRLRATDVAQPALGAVSLAAWESLRAFGVRADAFAGHSYGELVALCAAGRITPEELFTISRLRGRLMAEAGSRAEAGGMLAVKADEARIERILTPQGIDVIFANKNAPDQTVLSGPISAITRAAELLGAQKISCVRLDVAAAFHSPLVADAAKPFHAGLAKIGFVPGAMVWANSSAAIYPEDAALARELLAMQLALPVEWVKQIQAMAAAGIRCFVEVGPGARLTKLVESILSTPENREPIHTIALDSSNGKRHGLFDFACTLGRLAALGYEVQLSLEGAQKVPSKPTRSAATIEMSGVNYVRPRPAKNYPVLSNGKHETPYEQRQTSMMQKPAPQPVATQPPAKQPVSPVNAPAPSNAKPSTAPQVDSSAVLRALEITRENMTALQRMQEQTAHLHRQFLEGQDQSQRTLNLLLTQQQRLLQASMGIVGEPMLVPMAEVGPQPRRMEPMPPVALPPVQQPTPQVARVEVSPPKPAAIPAPPRVETPRVETPPVVTNVAPQAAPVVKIAPVAKSNARVEKVLLEVIAEKTGYPTEMLELGMTLDSDLGIDSIKRVEILSSLQEKLPEAPIVKPEHLGSLHSLRDIAAFLAGGTSQPKETKPTAAPSVRPTVAAPAPAISKPLTATNTLTRSIVRVVPVSESNPFPMPTPKTVHAWIADADLALLAGLNVERITEQSQPPASCEALVLIAPATASDDWVRSALFVVQKFGPALRAASGLLVTVSRMDGQFGFSAATVQREPLDGALAGLAKTAAREWPEIRVKAIDLAPDAPASGLRDELSRATLGEIGLCANQRITLQMHAESALPGKFTPFQPGDVVLVSGGARGVTAAVAIALAKHFRPKLVLLGRSPEPEAEPSWLANLADEAAIKQYLIQHNPGTSPRAIGEQVKSILQSREIRETLASIRAAGAEAIYAALDVRDAAAVQSCVRKLRAEHGPIRGLIHGAGVLADARIEQKTAEQFDRVYATKVVGVRNLLHEIPTTDLTSLVLFSSTTARLGRVGQVDYAMANEVLNKIAHQESSRRPICHVVSFNWGPWAGGMVGADLEKIFAKEGVGLIPLEAGAELLISELRVGAGPREIVVLAESNAPATATTPSNNGVHLPAALPLAFERMLSLEEFPILASHVLDGRAVVPVALLIEWLAHAAGVQNAGFAFHGCDNLRVLQALRVEPGTQLTLRAGASKASKREGMFIATAELRTVRDGKETLHAMAEVLLMTTLPPAPTAQLAPSLFSYALSPAQVYARKLLFHGPGLHGIERFEGISEEGIAALVQPAPPVNDWAKQPLRQQWLSDPMVVDCSFQLMVLWTQEKRGAGSLPMHIQRYRQYRRGFPSEKVRVVVAIERANDLHAIADLEYLDSQGRVIARVEGYEAIIDKNLSRAFERNVVAS
jgi:acyl transferase domain-containing protein/NAD(P)-dependent dehydrogenase (short-subunit alcohol dehydrogenase family)/acyl carrier protein